MKTPIKTLLKPLSLALFVAATLPTQSAYIRTFPPSDTIPAIGSSPHFCKAIGGESEDEGYSLIQTSDGSYAIAGFTKSFGAGEADVYVVKLDANGNLQWTKTIGGPTIEAGSSLIQTSDGGYAITGKTGSFGADVYVVKLDKNGDACCAVSQTSRVGSGGRLRSATSSIGSGGTLTSPTSSTSSGGTLTNQCP
jgi:hypothetical protein